MLSTTTCCGKPDAVCDGVLVKDTAWEGVALGVTTWLSDVDALGVAVALPDCVNVGVCVGLRLAVPLEDPVPLGVRKLLGVPLWLLERELD